MTRTPVAPERLLGRWLACCLHPNLASRVLPRSQQRLLVASWFVFAYLTVLAVLLLARP